MSNEKVQALRPAEPVMVAPSEKRALTFAEMPFEQMYAGCNEEVLQTAHMVMGSLVRDLDMYKQFGNRSGIGRLLNEKLGTEVSREDQVRMRLTRAFGEFAQLHPKQAQREEFATPVHIFTSPPDFDMSVQFAKSGMMQQPDVEQFAEQVYRYLNTQYEVAQDESNMDEDKHIQIFSLKSPGGQEYRMRVYFGPIPINLALKDKLKFMRFTFINANTNQAEFANDITLYPYDEDMWDYETRVGNSENSQLFVPLEANTAGHLVYAKEHIEFWKKRVTQPDRVIENHALAPDRQLQVIARMLRYNTLVPKNPETDGELAEGTFTKESWDFIKERLSVIHDYYTDHERTGSNLEYARAEFMVTMEANPFRALMYCIQLPALLPTLFPACKNIDQHTVFEWLQRLSKAYGKGLSQDGYRAEDIYKNASEYWKNDPNKPSGLHLFTQVLQQKSPKPDNGELTSEDISYLLKKNGPLGLKSQVEIPAVATINQEMIDSQPEIYRTPLVYSKLNSITSPDFFASVILDNLKDAINGGRCVVSLEELLQRGFTYDQDKRGLTFRFRDFQEHIIYNAQFNQRNFQQAIKSLAQNILFGSGLLTKINDTWERGFVTPLSTFQSLSKAPFHSFHTRKTLLELHDGLATKIEQLSTSQNISATIQELLQYSLAWQKQHLEQQISPIRSTFLQEQWEGLYDFSKEVIVPLQGIYNGIPPLLLEQHAQQIMHRLLADGEEHLTQYYLSLVRKQAS